MKFPEQYRISRSPRANVATNPGDRFGCFIIPASAALRRTLSISIIATDGDDPWSGLPAWEHVSVSLASRTPSWEEMCMVKALFWDPEDAVMELHPPRSTWINNHPYCLHLWRPRAQAIPLPPLMMV